MQKRVLPKPCWAKIKGASVKPKRLQLRKGKDDLYLCPVKDCDSNGYRSQRGCRKHVFMRHGWFYYFEKKPELDMVLGDLNRQQKNITKTKRSYTRKMIHFPKTCSIGIKFNHWLTSPGGGCKSHAQADSLVIKILKFLKYCCDDVSISWDVPLSVVDYCLGSISLISRFIDHLKDSWNVGYSGLIGYLNAINHLLDYRRTQGVEANLLPIFVASEIYINRMKKTLSKKMRIEWTKILSIDYLNSINCWATLKDLEKVIPYHAPRYKQTMLNASKSFICLPAHDLSFATSFIVTILFLLVKASRPMTYQHLTVTMIQSISSEGIIDQTRFKTEEKYGFDSLVFPTEVMGCLKEYIKFIRPRLNPVCDYLLICKNGTQLSRISDVFGRMVYQAIKKYIHPTRYRQIIETESSTRLSLEEQLILSEDQKHTSQVAKVHYKKQRSHEVALSGQKYMSKLMNNSLALTCLADINTKSSITANIDFASMPSLRSAKELPNNTDIKASLHCEQACHEDDINQTESESDTENNDDIGKRKKKTPFSKVEDQFLLTGIKKYGQKWTQILKDPCFLFDPSRKPSTLQVRAKGKGFI